MTPAGQRRLRQTRDRQGGVVDLAERRAERAAAWRIVLFAEAASRSVATVASLLLALPVRPLAGRPHRTVKAALRAPLAAAICPR